MVLLTGLGGNGEEELRIWTETTTSKRYPTPKTFQLSSQNYEVQCRIAQPLSVSPVSTQKFQVKLQIPLPNSKWTVRILDQEGRACSCNSVVYTFWPVPTKIALWITRGPKPHLCSNPSKVSPAVLQSVVSQLQGMLWSLWPTSFNILYFLH